ncbi:hypothetical protein H0H92_006356 [Tricholoma furcatifolium]|nr:hypothetical protein H0H92_006356 [Tricholoma furcatifolium]
MKPPQHPALSMGSGSKIWRRFHVLAFLVTASLLYKSFLVEGPNVDHLERAVAQCAAIATPAGPGPSYDPASRVAKGSDRHVVSTAPTLIQNAKIWTGVNNGTEVIYGDILLDKGVVVSIGRVSRDTLVRVKAASPAKRIDVVDAEGRWVTPGIVDLHSHLGLSSAPYLKGSADTNSRKAPILPWLRSIDGLNTHDEAYALTIAGGVTTAQILPGSANNIGENPSRTYSQTRMDSAWKFREAYESARKIRDAQDAFCARVESVQQRSWLPWSSSNSVASLGAFPQDLQWEALVDVLRGRVKLAVHCYEAVDLDAIVRLSNEFKFPIASYHHAGETYLVPDLLKKTWGGVPSMALFASNARKKREAYRNSEFAPRVLAEHGIPVVMKSDHPVLNSRYLVYEAQQAHYYGLAENLALASITSTPARAAGLGHRIGMLDTGYDADVVIWDSHPLALGATPVQVYIDGIAQLSDPQVLVKPDELQQAPKTPKWDREARQAVEYEGVPPLRGRKVRWDEPWTQDGARPPSTDRGVKFIGVKTAWVQDDNGDVHALINEDDAHSENVHSVVVRDGSIVLCAGENAKLCEDDHVHEVVDLWGGSLAPGLTTFGSPLGLVEILLEPSTSDGAVKDPLTGTVPTIAGGDDAVIRAVDGLQFEGRNTLLAYRSGVTRAITAPIANGFLAGLSATFDTGASNALDKGAITHEETALHMALSQQFDVSVSTQVATLRRLLYHSTTDVWQRVQTGEIPLVVDVDNADIMSTLLRLKSEYDSKSGNTLRLTFTGAAEAHLLAEEIGEAGVSVVITSPRPYPGAWENRRILPGPPLSRDSAVTALLAKNVNVAIGVRDDFDAHNARFNLAWVALESNGTMSKNQALQIATTNLDRAFGVTKVRDIVAYRGGSLFDFESKVAAVISTERGTIELL